MLIFVYIKVVISMSPILHDFMTLRFVTSYFGRVTLDIIKYVA